MKDKDLLKEMRDSIGTKDPIVFFEKMIDVFSLLFNRLDSLEQDLQKLKKHSALSIQWDPKVASEMLDKQIEIIRQDKENKDSFFNELSALKSAYIANVVTQNYSDFCQFWQETLGWHPFLDYDK